MAVWGGGLVYGLIRLYGVWGMEKKVAGSVLGVQNVRACGGPVGYFGMGEAVWLVCGCAGTHAVFVGRGVFQMTYGTVRDSPSGVGSDLLAK